MHPHIGSPGLWIGFTLFVLGMLALDLGVLHRKGRDIGFRGALLWTLLWLGLAVTFDALLFVHFDRQTGLEFLAGYVIEYALSVDNLFVFLLIFRYFSVPTRHQHGVLFWGILGALVTRLAFVLLGSALLSRFEWVALIFGAILVLGGIKMMKEEEVEVHPERNLVVRLVRRLIPIAFDDTGANLFVRRKGRIYATPLLLVLVVVEATDVVFAVDSIPAVFAVTRDPFIAYSSNIFAILGLRSLYMLVAGAFDRFYYLKWGLGLVLVFVGVKMLGGEHLHISTAVSLIIVAALLGSSMLLSFLRFPRAPAAPPKGEEKKDSNPK